MLLSSAVRATTDGLVIPKKLDRDLKRFLSSSPKIEVRNREIRNLAKQVLDDAQEGITAFLEKRAPRFLGK